MKKHVIAAVAVIALGAAGTTTASPVSRANAVRTAKDYLSTEGFSFKGLVGQLKYEGYSTSDATYGASHAGANWMVQAVRTAKDYLSTEGFSRRGLISQLEYEGYTPAQASHGAAAVGLG
jgi:hypothetical protein